MTEQEFNKIANQYCKRPQVRFDLLQFQDGKPGISGGFSDGLWTLHFNGAQGSGHTHEEAYQQMLVDDQARWQAHIDSQSC